MRRRTGGRGAFTLIELLVVIAIIAILMSLVAAGSMQIMESQRAANTVTNLKVVDKALKDAWSKVVSDAKKEVGISPAVMQWAGGDATRARVLWIKVRLMEAFPMTYGEILSPFPYQPQAQLGNQPLIPTAQRHYMATYQRRLAANGITAKNNPNPPTQSAACLLMALTEINRGGAALNPDNVSTADTDGDGLKELTDNWGHPLAFFRFPTNNDLQAWYANQPSARKFADPLDPDGKLANAGWWATVTSPSLFQQSVHQITYPSGQQPVAGAASQTWYVIPVVVSAGRDGQFGLPLPSGTSPAPMSPPSNQNQENDNIYSYRLQEGGPS